MVDKQIAEVLDNFHSDTNTQQGKFKGMWKLQNDKFNQSPQQSVAPGNPEQTDTIDEPLRKDE